MRPPGVASGASGGQRVRVGMCADRFLDEAGVEDPKPQEWQVGEYEQSRKRSKGRHIHLYLDLQPFKHICWPRSQGPQC